MSNLVPNKLQKIFEQTVALVLPTAIRSGGPVLINIKREETEGEQTQTPDKRAMFIQQFKRSMAEAFAEATKKPEAENESAAKKNTGFTREEMEERISKFSLMDKDLLEAQILIDRLCNTLQAEHQYDVDCLGMRLERLSGLTIERRNNPLCAKRLTSIFHQCCEILQPNKTASDAAMTNWGKALKEAYALWLKQLNQILIKQHILPRLDIDDINRRYEKKNQEKAREMRKNLIADITGKEQGEGIEISDDELMHSIKSLVANAVADKPELSKHIVSGSTSGTLATKEDIFEALRGITGTAQINAETGYRELPANELSLAEKVAALTDMQSRALDNQTQNAISLLSMMFDKLQHEEQIAEPIKPLINELQAPLLKLAVQKQDFFSNPDNPAQELINEIAQAGTHWTPKQNVSKDPFYKKISTIVDEISTSSEDADDNEGVFEEKLITLKDFLEREKRRSALLEERIIQAESVKARTDAARAQAENIIKKKIIRHLAEPNIATFLQDYWTQVLFFYLNRDEDYQSEEQQQVRHLIDNLLIFTPETLDLHIDNVFEQLIQQVHHIGLAIENQAQTLHAIRTEIHHRQQAVRDEMAEAAATAAKAEEQAQAAARAAAALSAAVNNVLERKDTRAEVSTAVPTNLTADIAPSISPQPITLAKDTLSTIGSTPARDNDTITFEPSKPVELTPTSTPEPTLDSLEINLELLETSGVDDDDDDDDDEILAEEDTAVEDIFDKQADMLRADTWFHYTKDSQDKLKIKLAAIIKHNGNYIFVNREGVKVITAKKPEVADLLRCGELTIVDDTVFFDRALESVIQSLRR